MDTLLVMFQLSVLIEEAVRRATRELDVSPFDVMVMAWLHKQPGISCVLVADRIGRPRQNVQRTLDRLEARELAQRDVAPNGKQTLGWFLTPSGETLYRAAGVRLENLDQAYGARKVDLLPVLQNLEVLMLALRGHRDVPFGAAPELVVPPPWPQMDRGDH